MALTKSKILFGNRSLLKSYCNRQRLATRAKLELPAVQGPGVTKPAVLFRRCFVRALVRNRSLFKSVARVMAIPYRVTAITCRFSSERNKTVLFRRCLEQACSNPAGL